MLDTTLDIVFIVTYYLESHNATTICYIFHFFANQGQVGCFDIKGIVTSLLGKKIPFIIKLYSTV